MRISLKVFLFFGLAALATPSFAQVHIGANFGPPARRTELRGDAPSRTSRWTSGYYTYNTNRSDYDWNQGKWQEPPSSHHSWVAPRYVAHGNHYDYHEGTWRDNARSNARGNRNNRADQGTR